MKSSKKTNTPLKSSEGYLEIEKLQKHLSLMEKTHSWLSEFMETLKKEKLDEREGETVKNLLESVARSIHRTERAAQHILDIVNKNQKTYPDDGEK